MYDFKGKTALVTGASKGIGEACARQLDACGARVALVARNREMMEGIAAKLSNAPIVIAANLSSETSTAECAARALEELGGIDILVNNAGLGWNEKATAITAKRLDLQFAVNLRNLILLTTAVSKSLIERKGSVVNISSVAAWGGGPEQAIYAASKGGLNSYTANLGRAWGELGVRVNAIAPGNIDTPIWEPLVAVAGGRDQLVAELTKNTPMKRLGTSDEIASVVCFLASDGASFITGQTIRVDGGLVA